MNQCPEIVATKGNGKAPKKVGDHFTATATSRSQNALCYLAGARGGEMTPLEDWEVVLDTMVNRWLVESIWESPSNIEITGVGGTVQTQLEGKMRYFGTVNVCESGSLE